jgi:hypothetical protein
MNFRKLLMMLLSAASYCHAAENPAPPAGAPNTPSTSATSHLSPQPRACAPCLSSSVQQGKALANLDHQSASKTDPKELLAAKPDGRDPKVEGLMQTVAALTSRLTAIEEESKRKENSRKREYEQGSASSSSRSDDLYWSWQQAQQPMWVVDRYGRLVCHDPRAANSDYYRRHPFQL